LGNCKFIQLDVSPKNLKISGQKTNTVDIREKAVDVPSQEAMTRDNISCSINAVIYYRVKEEQVDRSIINVKNLDYAMTQFAQTTMRNIV
jgi:regulator of protease activity HflC (stomatin/prohibitin superfamily)